MNDRHATDWDAYYSKPAKAASFTRKTTEKRLIRAMDDKLMGEPHYICELGGANSCFFRAIRQKFPKAHYTIIDNNLTGIELFKKTHPDENNVELINASVVEAPVKMRRADVVFSTGLIEHFSPENTAKVIQYHFACAEPGAIVIITFPTPTWLYALTRGLAELFGMWKFYDERPLEIQPVVNEIKKYAEICDVSINWGTILTQGVVVARVAVGGEAAVDVQTGRV